MRCLNEAKSAQYKSKCKPNFVNEASFRPLNILVITQRQDPKSNPRYDDL